MRDMKTITNIKKELRLYQWDKEIKDIEFDTIHTPKGNTPMERVEIDSIDIPTYIDETPLDLLDNQITIQTLFEEAKLSDRQIEVLQMFYGLGCEELTTHQISEKLGLGICRIQQIKEKSIRMLRKIKNNIQL